MVTSSAAAEDWRRTAAGGTLEMVGLEPFITEVERRADVTFVRPHGDLEIATAGRLHATLNGIESAEHLVLDLRGLSFIDSTGLHLLVTLHKRAQRDGFQLTLVAPAAPVEKAIQLCGLDETLPFVEIVDAVQSDPGWVGARPSRRHVIRERS
jgi:anti-sigma B factor antagonist